MNSRTLTLTQTYKENAATGLLQTLNYACFLLARWQLLNLQGSASAGELKTCYSSTLQRV